MASIKNGWQRRIASAMIIGLSGQAGGEKLICSDGVHLTLKGAELIGHHVAETIKNEIG